MSRRSLLIVGWSARAAAQSARRAGFAVHVVDAFGDVDLRQAADSWRRLISFDQLSASAAALPADPWLYAGGLENHPRVVATLAAARPLLGNDAATLRRVRDPFVLQAALLRHGFDFPETKRSTDGDLTTAWLVKPFRSGGGLNVRRYDGLQTLKPGEYLQQFASGVVCGASFIAAAGKARLLGVCRALPDDDPRSSFRYRGSIGPLPLGSSLRAKLEQLGDALADEFGLRGLFGVDLVFDGDRVFTLEVNPRYTASMELIERTTGAKLIDLHVRACRGDVLPEDVAAAPTTFCGKRIVYHDAADAGPLRIDEPLNLPDIADIPTPGTTIHPGEPIATVFASGSTFDEVANQLHEREKSLRLAASLFQRDLRS